MKITIRYIFFPIVLFAVLSLNISAQEKVYLSGQDAGTAIDWEFKVSDGRNSGFWTTTPVPSCWETEGFGFYLYGLDSLDWRTGHGERETVIGNYRHTFSFSPNNDKRYFIVFQGSMTDTKVTLNQEEVGFHQGGFTEFKLEITDFLIDGNNVLEVEVNSSSTNESLEAAERFADFWMFSGIFRPVFIQEVPSEFIEHVAIDAQMNGDFNMWVYTNGIKNANTISAQVYDAQHNRVGNPFTAKISNKKTTLTSYFQSIKQWSHEFPNLYSVEIELMGEQGVLHTYKQKFGFRTFEVRDHDGFYLNGKRILLKGANVHSFSPETGRTLSKADMENTFHLLREANFNTVRPPHYPPDSYFFKLADSLGMLAMAEITGWHRPLDTDIGTQIVREVVTRDVNHPSIILWSNGNHRSHNPELDPVFHQWDIQKRRPLKNAARTEDIFENYNPEWGIVNTTFYPDYPTLMNNLFELNLIVLPNEVIHALYDGGGGANLKTFWDAFEASEVGGGMMIWAFLDEGLLRTDMGYVVDNQDNKAPDGIVGPDGEKSGSFYAVREIWSPVVIQDDEIGAGFSGGLDVHNKFTFTNLNQCDIVWKLINFANPDGTPNGHRTVATGRVHANVEAGEKGKLSIELPDSYVNNDALAIHVYDTKGMLVYDKRLPISTSKRPTFRASSDVAFEQMSGQPFNFQRHETIFTFDENSGVLLSVFDKGEKTSLGNFPFLTYEAAEKALRNNNTGNSTKASVTQEGSNWIIESKNTKGFDYLKWTLKPNGEILLDYAYTLETGRYHYAGIGIEVSADDVLRKRWLGAGPERIWKNRTQGGILDVYAVEKHVNIPGQVYNPPAFEGCFAPWNWAVFYLNDYLNVGFQNRTDVTLGVLNPVNGYLPQKATWYYPAQEGFYFFDHISAVGSKWKDATEFGPDAQPAYINGQIKGVVSMFINWNKPTHKVIRIDVEIE